MLSASQDTLITPTRTEIRNLELGSVLRALRGQIQSVLTDALGGKCYNQSRFTAEETEAQGGSLRSQS